MPALTGSLSRALANGAIIVTPNRRLARTLIALHDSEQRAAGRNVWPGVTVLPWDAWLDALWQDAVAAGVVADDASLRTAVQAAHAWNRIVAAFAAPLINPRGAAGLAADAWALVHAWGAGGESWRGWTGTGDDDDPATFARWASRYANTLADTGAIDRAQLPDRLAAWAARVDAWRHASWVLAGFIELSPQQERLVAALAAAGARIAREDSLPVAQGGTWWASGETPRDEIALALAWARDLAIAQPDAAIAIAVEDLALRRDEIRALADDLLCPALQWPESLDAPRPYNLSLGTPLADVPLIAAALDLIGWADAPLPIGRASALLRSPYVAGEADAWMRRARLEADWLEQGRRDISLQAALGAIADVDPPLTGQWTRARDRHRPPATGTPRAFGDAWRAWLLALGWPGGRTLESGEFQARRAWDEALAIFATLGSVEARLTRPDALEALRSQLAGTVFQPESPPAPIQIVGVLEAAGIPFDALWVAGLAAECWPPAPQPNPLIPIAWQRERNVPRATAARELTYAQALTGQFARAAPMVVFSHARSDEEHPRSPSRLLHRAPELGVGAGAFPVATAQAQFALGAPREFVADDRVPPLPSGCGMRGGAALIEAQSDCPFKAAATFRLGTEAWPQPIDGLSSLERGTLVHAAMAAFWRDVGSHAALIALAPEALAQRISAAVEAAMPALPATRWRDLPPLVAAGEAERMNGLVAAWLEAQERPRPPFSVLGVETETSLMLGDLTLSLRLDRVDALVDGGTVIIDYKTGSIEPPDAWFAPRPQAPQLGLYTLARRAAAPTENVRAVAFAQIRAGEFKVQGLAADEEAWPGMKLPSGIRTAGLANWTAAEAHWTEALGALAADVASGAASVVPRSLRKTCARCRLQPLCRIGALALEDRDAERDE